MCCSLLLPCPELELCFSCALLQCLCSCYLLQLLHPQPCLPVACSLTAILVFRGVLCHPPLLEPDIRFMSATYRHLVTDGQISLSAPVAGFVSIPFEGLCYLFGTICWIIKAEAVVLWTLSAHDPTSLRGKPAVSLALSSRPTACTAIPLMSVGIPITSPKHDSLLCFSQGEIFCYHVRLYDQKHIS